ncbi:unnamed protein product, partial [Polarella glacialis]
GSLELGSLGGGDETMVVSFSDSSGEVFGVQPRVAAADPEARRQIKELLAALLRCGTSPGHVIAVVRHGMPGDVDGGFTLEGSRTEWC